MALMHSKNINALRSCIIFSNEFEHSKNKRSYYAIHIGTKRSPLS